jgi:uncharacterized protein (TIRG00374 family)
MHGRLARKRFLQLVALALPAALLWVTFADVPAETVAERLGALGPELLWLPLPFYLGQILDTRATQLLLGHLQCRASFGRVFMSQVAGEAAVLAFPMGFLVGESLRPWLLGVGRPGSLPSNVAAVTGRKFLLILTQGFFIALALTLGFGAAEQLSRGLFGGHGLIWLSLGIAFMLVSVAAVLPLSLGQRNVADSVHRWCLRVAPAPLASRLGRRRENFARTDEKLHQLFRLPLRAWGLPVFSYLTVWLLEGFELWLILRLLGVELSVATALYLEAMVGTLRSIVPLAPAGLGIQDAGYAALFTLLGLPGGPGLGAAFSIIKRSREALSCVVGGVCFSFARRSPTGLWIELPEQGRASPARESLLPP